MALGLCAEWTGLTASEFSKARTACTDQTTFDTNPCPQDDELGTCEHWNFNGTIMAPEKLKMHIYKSEVLRSVDSAKDFCDTGTFVEAKAPQPHSSATGVRVGHP
jgi:hypothetical protein